MTNQSISATPVPLERILGMRDAHRREMSCQIVRDAWHGRGFTASYELLVGDEIVGYGSVGGSPGDPPETLMEFFVLPEHRGMALPLFKQLVAASGARRVDAQTNDRLLLLMLLDCAVDVSSDTILFADGRTTTLPPPDTQAILRRVTEADARVVFEHTMEPVGSWGLEVDDRLVATGGQLFHYNPPYGDLFMEVAVPYRRRGFGSYLIQELKRLSYEAGSIPAARCDANNIGSRRTLERAGMFPCGRMLRGRLMV
ncbi:MAG: GNAT family N-acetyltransferase [bacterium]